MVIMSNFFKNKPKIEGFDTETYQGNLLIICNSVSCFEYDGEHPMDLIDWLYKNSQELNFFYNLRFDFSVILKPYLTDDNIKEVRELKEIEIGKYKISFIDKKFFTIKWLKSRNTNKYPAKRFFDIAQFYTNEGKIMTLDDAGKMELNEGKNNEELGINREFIGTVNGYYILNRELIQKYCIKDADLTKRLSEKRVDIFAQLFDGKYPKNYYSSASISKSYLSYRHINEQYVLYQFL